MSGYISSTLRDFVGARAMRLCEYCLISEEDTFFGCEIDHIISIKHGGESNEENLAFACEPCNLGKGSDLGSIDWHTRELVRFYNPRIDCWSAHFRCNEDRIETLTPIGLVTARILQFNSWKRRLERAALIAVNRFPSPTARNRFIDD